MTIRLALIFLAAAILVGCSAGADATKYRQTWPKGYGETTCQDWFENMTDDQRRVAAADMLYVARKKDGAQALPSDELVATFALDLSDICHAPAGETGSIGDIGALTYLAYPEKFKP